MNILTIQGLSVKRNLFDMHLRILWREAESMLGYQVQDLSRILFNYNVNKKFDLLDKIQRLSSKTNRSLKANNVKVTTQKKKKFYKNHEKNQQNMSRRLCVHPLLHTWYRFTQLHSKYITYFHCTL